MRPSKDQIREDIAACEKIGAEEVILEVGFTLGGQPLTNLQKLLEEFPPAGSREASGRRQRKNRPLCASLQKRGKGSATPNSRPHHSGRRIPLSESPADGSALE